MAVVMDGMIGVDDAHPMFAPAVGGCGGCMEGDGGRCGGRCVWWCCHDGYVVGGICMLLCMIFTYTTHIVQHPKMYNHHNHYNLPLTTINTIPDCC